MLLFTYWLIGISLVCFRIYSVEVPAIVEQSIDIVYLWVDGNDPEWQAIKNSYLPVEDFKIVLPNADNTIVTAAKDGATDNRYADNHELRYSLRSVYQYAPFVNHIYIVTMNQKPAWLLPHPKITIVDHTEIFKNLDDLPTFNSHAIESNLHRIPHLSEYFIYFNDDVFLGAPVTAKDFFIDDKVKVVLEKGLSPSGPPIPNETAYRRAWRNSNAFLDEHYTVQSRYRLCHAPFALRKTYIQEFQEKYPHIFAINSSHKFRSDYDYNVINGLLQYYWLYHDKAVTVSMSNMMVSLRSDECLHETSQKLQELNEIHPASFCLQDVMTEKSNLTKAMVRNFLQEYYPEPAPWEN